MLAEVAFAVSQGDRSQGQAHVGGRAQSIAGQNSEATAVGGNSGNDGNLHRKIGDDPAFAWFFRGKVLGTVNKVHRLNDFSGPVRAPALQDNNLCAEHADTHPQLIVTSASTRPVWPICGILANLGCGRLKPRAPQPMRGSGKSPRRFPSRHDTHRAGAQQNPRRAQRAPD